MAWQVNRRSQTSLGLAFLMTHMKISKKILLISFLIITTLFLLIILLFSIKGTLKIGIFSANTATAVVIEKEKLTSSLPARLRIPKINVNAKLEHVGLTPSGAMDSPLGPDNVAWFNLGPIPGNIGSSVIDGHSGWKDNLPAVFDNLNKLSKGDKIYVEDEKGITVTFVVREIKTYDKNANASDVFYSDDGRVHLNLITCSGAWDKIIGNSSTRLVVFSDIE